MIPDFNPDLPVIDDYLSLFINDIPLMDVRAPIEFDQGSFPMASNIPLINDAERHHIGTVYKDSGQPAAIELGTRLVNGTVRDQRTDAWQQFANEHPNGALYCFRGGLRSKISQQWLFEQSGIMYPRIKGGYKALRNFLLQALGDLAGKVKPIVLGGQTGSGKTRLLQKLMPTLDLEGIANHRGSAFGRFASPQPAPIDFENTIAIGLIKLFHNGNPYFAVEDESRNIGSRHLPPALYENMSTSPLVILEVTFDERVATTVQEYAYEALADYQRMHGMAEGTTAWAGYMRDSIERVSKRLGGDRFRQASALLEAAISEFTTNGTVTSFEDWVAFMLRNYYDSMYDYQIERKKDRIIFRGNPQQVIDYLQTSYEISNINN